MIANLSSDIEHYEETLTTCRFSTRCAKLENTVKIPLFPPLYIERFKKMKK
jgi:hypothetical protein